MHSQIIPRQIYGSLYHLKFDVYEAIDQSYY